MSRFIMPRQGVKSQNLSPEDGAKLHFKVIGQGIGGTNKTVFTDEALSVAATNPVIADATGLFEELWLNGDYDTFLTDKNDIQLWGPETIRDFVQTKDDTLRADLAAITSGKGGELVGFKDTAAASVATNLSAYLNLKVKGLKATFAGVGNGVASTAADNTALLNAFNSGKIIEIEDGEFHFSSTLKMSAIATEIHGFGSQTILKYTGTGTGIDFDGYPFCNCSDFFMWSLTGAIGIDIHPDAGETRFPHFWELNRVLILGDTPDFSTTAVGTTPTAFAGGGIRVEKCFYGEARHTESSFCLKAFVGTNLHNGNTYTGCIARGNIEGVVWAETGAASTGSTWQGGELESSGSATSLIKLFDSQSSIFTGVRLELTGAGTHIIVNPNPGQTAFYNQFVAVAMEGTSAAYTFGDSIGTDQIVANTIIGGRSNGAWTIGSDVTQLSHPVGDITAHAALVPVSGSLTDNGVRTNIDLSGNLSFTLGITGLITGPTASTLFTKRGQQVHISIPNLTGTSNSTTGALTGLPPEIRPLTDKIVVIRVQNNGLIAYGTGTVTSLGTIILSPDAFGTTLFVSSGSKGVLATEIHYSIK